PADHPPDRRALPPQEPHRRLLPPPPAGPQGLHRPRIQHGRRSPASGPLPGDPAGKPGRRPGSPGIARRRQVGTIITKPRGCSSGRAESMSEPALIDRLTQTALASLGGALVATLPERIPPVAFDALAEIVADERAERFADLIADRLSKT